MNPSISNSVSPIFMKGFMSHNLTYHTQVMAEASEEGGVEDFTEVELVVQAEDSHVGQRRDENSVDELDTRIL